MWQKKRTNLHKNQKQRIIKRDNGKCHYCHLPDPLMTIDHVVPVYAGGTNSDNNLVAACGPCNNGRSRQIYRGRHYVRFKVNYR